MNFFYRLLDRLPYVQRLQAACDYAAIMVARFKDEQERERDRGIGLERQLEQAVGERGLFAKQLAQSRKDVEFLFEQHKQLEVQNTRLRGLNAALAEEILEYRKLQFPQAKSIVVSPAVSDAIDRKEWVCSCQRRHQFYIVSCDTCMRTRPPRILSPSPSSNADRSEVQPPAGGDS